MRRTAVLVALMIAGGASADRLVNAPRGGKLAYGIARAEWLFEPTIRNNNYLYLGLGLTTAFDVEIRSERINGEEPEITFDVGYNVTAPITDLAPGISLGVQDMLDKTRDGRRFYFAFTDRRSARDSLLGGVAVELTLGFLVGSRNSAFVSASLPFSEHARLLAEHDGFRITSGLELRPTDDVAFRVLFRENETLVGVQSRVRF